MYEWINTKQCIIYVNNLLSFEDPEKIIRIAWLFSKQIYKLIEIKIEDEDELIELKEKHFKIIDKLKKLKTIIREINTAINIFLASQLNLTEHHQAKRIGAKANKT